MASLIKRNILLNLAFLCVGLVCSNDARSSHAAGMEIFYRWVSDSTYEFTVVFFRDCEGNTASAQSSLAIKAYSPSNGNSFTSGFSSIYLSRMPTTGSGVPPLELEDLYNCLKGNYCIEEHVYRGTWACPYPASDWTFGTEICCTPYAVRNMAPGPLHVKAGLNNLDFPDSIYKSSPIFHNRRPNHPGHLNDVIYNPPTVGICNKNFTTVSQAVRNYTGDEIRYSFFIPMTTNGVANTYGTGFSLSNPMPTTSGIFIDSITGIISLTPDSITDSAFVVGVRATAYNYDTVLIGGTPTAIRIQRAFIDRNIYFLYEDSGSCRPDTFHFVDTLQLNEAQTMEIGCSDNPLLINFNPLVTCSSIDSNASHVEIVSASNLTKWGLASAEPFKCRYDGLTNGFRLYLDSILVPGTYYLYFKVGSDGNTMTSECGPDLAPYQDTLTINVLPQEGNGVLIADENADIGDTITMYCSVQTYKVFLSVDYRCYSLAWNESDVAVYDLSYTPPKEEYIYNATTHGGSCNNGFSDAIHVTMGGRLDLGLYRFVLREGTDKNTVLGYCNNSFDTSEIIIRVEETKVNLGPDLVFCEGDFWLAKLEVNRYYSSVYWSTGSTDNYINVIKPGMYWVEVRDYSTACTDRDTVYITEENCWLGTETETRENIKIYPNPNSGEFVVEMPYLDDESTIVIKSLIGKEILRSSIKGQKMTINVDDAGLYLMEIIGKDFYFVQKVVVE